MEIYGVLTALIVAAVIFVVVKLKSMSAQKNENDATWLVEAYNEKQKKLKKSEPFRDQVKVLLSKNPKWEEIFSVFNPRNDKEINELLIQFRGPHLFAPNVAVNILEKCLKVMESRSLSIDSKSLLRMALEEGDKVLNLHR